LLEIGQSLASKELGRESAYTEIGSITETAYNQHRQGDIIKTLVFALYSPTHETHWHVAEAGLKHEGKQACTKN